MATDLYEIRGGKMTFHLHPGQTRAFNSQKRFILVLAGSVTGPEPP